MVIRQENYPDSNFPSKLGQVTIRLATLNDDNWLLHLSKIFSNQIGFIPNTARHHRLSLQHIKIININNTPAGFMIHSHGVYKPAHLAQIALSKDAWSNGIAEHSINWLLKLQHTAKHKGLTAKVRSDLLLNRTAKHMLANIIDISHPQTARQLPITTYQWDDHISNLQQVQ